MCIRDRVELAQGQQFAARGGDDGLDGPPAGHVQDEHPEPAVARRLRALRTARRVEEPEVGDARVLAQHPVVAQDGDDGLDPVSYTHLRAHETN